MSFPGSAEKEGEKRKQTKHIESKRKFLAVRVGFTLKLLAIFCVVLTVKVTSVPALV